MPAVSRPYDPANYTTVPDVLALAASLEDRIAELEAALVALIDAVDEKDAAKIERALFVGRGLTF